MRTLRYWILWVLILPLSRTYSQPTVTIQLAIDRQETSTKIPFEVTSNGYSIVDQGAYYRIFGQSPSSNIFVNSGRIVAQDTVLFSGLTAATRYSYGAYVVFDNSGNNDTVFSTESNFYTLATEPTSHVGFISITNATTSSVTLSYSAATNAVRYGVFSKDGEQPIDPSLIVDGISVTSQTVGDARTEAPTTTHTRSGLLPDFSYSVTIIPINRSGLVAATNNYLTSGNVSHITFRLAPTQQASNIVLQDFSGGTATIAWTNGNGNGRILKMNTTNSFTNPTIGSYPSANPVWQNSGEQVVYNGNGNSATISGLSAGHTYWFRLYELNNPQSGRALYNTSTSTNNPISLFMLGSPSNQDQQIQFSGLTTSQVTVSWTKGDGDYRIVVMNSTNSFSNPINNTTYTADDSWNNAGEQVVYNGSGNSVTVTNLQANNIYYFRVFAYNGTSGTEKYNLQTATDNPNNVSTSTNLTWTGAISSDWGNSSNWNPPMTPTNQTSLFIPYVSSNYPVLNTNTTVKNITLAPLAELTVQNGVILTINENFTIQGNASGSGSLLVEANGLVSVGQTSKFVRHTGSNNYWHFASVPTNNSDIKQFTGHYVNQWNETTQSWTQLNTSSTLQVMRGYSIKQYNRDTAVFTGTFNNGSLSIEVTNSGSGSYPGLNIIGNPYPSAIDWKAASGWTRNNIDPTIYVYHTQSQTYYTYNYQTHVASPASFDGVVPAGNGYYILAQQNTTLATTNDVRVHSGQPFYKNEQSYRWPTVRFSISNDKFSDELVLYFHPEAPETVTYDGRFSAIKLFPPETPEKSLIYAKTNNNSYPNLSVVALNEKLLNKLAYGQSIDIPISIISYTEKQIVTIKEENIHNNYTYLLYNPISKEETPLGSYSEIVPGEYILRIKQKSTVLDINETLTNNKLIIDCRNRELYVSNNQNISGDLMITDISGRIVEKLSVGAFETIAIDMKKQNGIFVVTFANQNQIITKKILIP